MPNTLSLQHDLLRRLVHFSYKLISLAAQRCAFGYPLNRLVQKCYLLTGGIDIAELDERLCQPQPRCQDSATAFANYRNAETQAFGKVVLGLRIITEKIVNSDQLSITIEQT